MAVKGGHSGDALPGLLEQRLNITASFFSIVRGSLDKSRYAMSQSQESLCGKVILLRCGSVARTCSGPPAWRFGRSACLT